LPDDELDPYQVLQVGPEVDQRTLKAAYRELARRFHPDVSESEASRRAMVRLNQAWELVNTPAKRTATDQRLRGISTLSADPSRVPGTGASGGRSGVPRRGAGGWGAGAAGPPPGRPSGSKLDFGIYLGWTLGEIVREDPGYLDWLAERREGKPFLAEIKALRHPKEAQADAEAAARKRGLFRRR
jgi:curved DNA-binding protein CbpA